MGSRSGRRDPHWPRARRGWVPLALIGVVMAAGAAAQVHVDDTLPCRADASVEPDGAFVGEQILHRVRIAWRPPVERIEWLRAPLFPEHRAVALDQPVTTAGASDVPPGQHQEERRALFAARAGELEIAAATLRCFLRDPDGRTDILDVELPAARVSARALPAEGRPTAFSGLVGPIAFERRASATRTRAGGGVGITLSLRGPGNVWVAPLDLPDDTGPGETTRYRVFPASEDSDESRDGRLVVRRIARFDLVPERAGRLVVPGQGIDWFDPHAGAYRRSEVDPIVIDVFDEPASATDGSERPPGTERQTLPRETSGGRLSALVRTAGAAVAVAALAFFAGWLLFRARPGKRAVDAALAAAEAARLRGDHRREAEALERAVRAVLVLRSPALAGLSPPELEMRGQHDEGLLEAAALLSDLERDRYAGSARTPDRAAVRAWIATTLR